MPLNNLGGNDLSGGIGGYSYSGVTIDSAGERQSGIPWSDRQFDSGNGVSGEEAREQQEHRDNG